MWGRWKSEDETGAQQEMDELGLGSLETVEMGYGLSKRCRGLGIKYGLEGKRVRTVEVGTVEEQRWNGCPTGDGRNRR